MFDIKEMLPHEYDEYVSRKAQRVANAVESASSEEVKNLPFEPPSFDPGSTSSPFEVDSSQHTPGAPLRSTLVEVVGKTFRGVNIRFPATDSSGSRFLGQSLSLLENYVLTGTLPGPALMNLKEYKVQPMTTLEGKSNRTNGSE